MVSCSADSTVKITKNLQHHHLGNHNDSVTALSALNTQNMIASAGLDKKIRIWDLSVLQMSCMIVLVILAEIITHSSVYAISCAGSIIAAATSVGNTVKLFDSRSNQQILEFYGHNDMVRTLQLRYC